MKTFPLVRGLKPVIGGYTESTDYVTWEVKVCDHCKRYVLEYYRAVEVQLADISKIKLSGLPISDTVKLLND